MKRKLSNRWDRALPRSLIAACGRHHRQRRGAAPPFAVDGWQAGTCTADPCLHLRRPGSVLHPGRRAPAVGFTEFIVNTNGLGSAKPRSANSRRARRPAGRAQRQPPGDPAVPESRPSRRTRLPAPPTPGRDQRGDRAQPAGRRRAAALRSRSTTSCPNQGEPALFGFSVACWSSTDVYLDADVAWEGDYHEGFTIRTSPNAGPAGSAQPPGLRRDQAGNGTLPHDAEHLPRPPRALRARPTRR